MELVYDDKTGTWGEAPEAYATIECATKKDYEYAKKAIKGYKELEAKHWDECRQIAHYDDEIKRLKAADVQPVNQWISVNDRLPENCIEVLVYDTDCGIVIGWYDKEIGDFAADFISPLDAVTHWQPLPEPPKDGDTN